MPFVQRVVSPTFLSRSGYGRVVGPRSVAARAMGAAEETSVKSDSVSVFTVGIRGAKAEDPHPHCSKESDVIEYSGSTASGVGFGNSQTQPSGRALVNGHELESVINITLSNALRQLASLVIIANDIFLELNEELQQIGDRSKQIKEKIGVLEHKLDEFDPKQVAVPEGDLDSFTQLKKHHVSKKLVDEKLFTSQSRSRNIKVLYDAAAKAPLHSWEDYKTVNDEGSCDLLFKDKTKELKAKIDAEIETRMPAALGELRKWTSTEALGEITVTPDCISRVGCSICTNQSTICNKSFPSTTVEDNCSVLTCGHPVQTTSVNDDLPLDHRLPSPEEQCHIIAQKFPAEVVSVDISGRRFERMCLARKSMASCNANICETNDPEAEDQGIKRRSRSRKPRGKRRNTIAGIDQKEIEEAATGQTELTKSSNDLSDNECKVTRSKSNDIMKNFSTMSSSAIDVGKATITRFNSLRLWGRHRLKLINRGADKQKPIDNELDNNIFDPSTNKLKRKNSEKEKKLSHERKESYSSSEKSLMLSSQSTVKISEASASINPVKLRESSSLRRQRRSGVCHKDEPHSSSGNWSASSESGRASIGSEITIQPKSSASSTSLNQSNIHPSSGPPSSIISRRRFLNTSASSSVTSEGTATPDLQVNDICYDDETSSAYSCDTEGYYTSFHVDSGLKTLKEEDPITPVQSTSALSSTNSFESSSNHTILTAENEYELFGRGSTSTTTSSAGTVCTTLMAGESDKSLLKAPDAPERKSSLIKLTRSGSNASCSTLERSYSSSTVGSTLERSGTIKRNGVLLRKEVSAMVHEEKDNSSVKDNNIGYESLGSIDNNSLSPYDNPSKANSEFEYSESSDLEGVDRIERIKQKTTIDSSRIPSMCIITPTTSDDENSKDVAIKKRQPIAIPVDPDVDLESYATLKSSNNFAGTKHHQTSSNKTNSKKSLHPLNHMFGKLKGVLPNIKRLPDKEHAYSIDDGIYDSIGEYVTIADVTNNNNALKPGAGVYYSNDVVRRNLAAVLSGNVNQETEYVSLNELPCTLRKEEKGTTESNVTRRSDGEKIDIANMAGDAPFGDDGNTIEQRELHKGARVTFDAQGKIIYNSDSLKRRKASHSTFVPGPHVKECEYSSVLLPLKRYFANSPKNERDRLNCETNKSENVQPRNNLENPTDLTNKFPSKEGGSKMQSDDLAYSLKQQDIDKGYLHLSHSKMTSPNLLQQNNQIYWTLQNRRKPRTKAPVNDDISALIDDDYNKYYSCNSRLSTPSPTSFTTETNSPCSLSPIMPRTNPEAFKTSTPLRDSVQSNDRSSPKLTFGQQKSTASVNSGTDGQYSKACSDRLGASKTSLMDFKKLLLAKSSKANATGKVSAVEILKLNKNEVSQSKKPLNSSMNILELSGSPKTFANRRMLKQGVFGSPSKTIMMKQRGNGWRLNSPRTDVISTSIPEANSEEDNSSSTSSSSTNDTIDNLVPEKCVIEESVDLKNNMFLQVEKNNFMRGEVQFNSAIKSNLHRNNLDKCRAQFFIDKRNSSQNNSTDPAYVDDNVTEDIKSIPALETAL